MIPVIIFHMGNQPYVHQCIEQGLKFNNDIHLLSDVPDSYKMHETAKVIDYKHYTSNMFRFQSLYKHYSTNSYQLEFICIIRWMCICEYMYRHNIQKAFICDSDVLLYDNIETIVKTLYPEDMYLCSSPSKNLTGGQSIFTLQKLYEFVNFVFEFYQTQIPRIDAWYKTYKEGGGVCDITLLYYFAHNAKEFQGPRLPNYPCFENDLTKIIDDEFTFDLHMGSNGNHIHPEDYEMTDNHKHIKIIDGKAYCYNMRLKKDIRFVLLHFQGNNKRIMNQY